MILRTSAAAGAASARRGGGKTPWRCFLCGLALVFAVTPSESQARPCCDEAEPLRCQIRAVDPAQDLVHLAADASTSVSIEQQRNRLEDCLAIDEIVAAAIESTPRLNRLWSVSSAALDRLKARAGLETGIALDEDAAQFRASLRQDVITDRATRTLSKADIERLADLLEARQAWLVRVDLDRRALIGTWRNVSGEVMISAIEDAGFGLEASIVDPLQSAWSCEASLWIPFEGADDRNLAASPVTLSADGGVLTIVQEADPQSCGAHASLSGLYFAVDPPGPRTP